MGFVVPLLAGIGTALTAGAATGAAATAIGGITAALAVKNVSSILGGGGSKSPAASPIAPPPPVAAAAPIAPAAAPVSPVNPGKNTSLASLSPGLALGGTAGFLGASLNKGGKSLLGQ